jgi:hypothetical protein
MSGAAEPPPPTRQRSSTPTPRARHGPPGYLQVWRMGPLDVLDEECPSRATEYRRDAQLIAVLEYPAVSIPEVVDVDAIAVSGEWIRHARTNRGRAEERSDRRWQHAAVACGLYLADEPAAAMPSGTAGSPSAGLLAHATSHDITADSSIFSSNHSSLDRLAAIGLPALSTPHVAWLSDSRRGSLAAPPVRYLRPAQQDHDR